MGTAPPGRRADTAPLVEVRADRDEVEAQLCDDEVADAGEAHAEPPLVQARRYVVADDPLDQARRFEVVRQSIAERSAARRFELAVDPPDDDTPKTPTPRGATC